ncbi:alpha/beta hydrolase [Gordonia sp. CPCC 205515]|uniref:alpha/beta hydrolase family protein n=1 Tax=Gordonia sp. CPCC 205515 TaxID=3140791 RepID=UPI003AF35C10
MYQRPTTARALIAASVILIMSVTAVGCSTSSAPRQPAAAPSSAQVPQAHRGGPGLAIKDLRNLPESSTIGVRRYYYSVPDGPADPKQNWVDLYLPGAAGKEATPVVVLIHGGAWQSQIGADSFVTFARHLAERGLAVFNVEYRRVGSGGGWPTTFTDVASALDTIPEVAKGLPQLDIKESVVVGHSAGGQLAVWAGTRHRLDHHELGSAPEFTPEHVISLAGPLDMRRAVALGDSRIVRVLGGTPTQYPQRYAAVDPIQNLDPSIGVIAVNGGADTTVPPVLAEKYVDADNAAGGRARAIIMPGQTHSSIVNPHTRAFDQIVELITRIANDAHADELE